MTESVRYEDLATKIARIAFLKQKLSTDARWAVKGMLRIYEYQTADEKAVQETHNMNGVGFSGADANILSSFSEQVLKGRSMSEKQMAIIFKKMTKYAKQLETIAASKTATR